MSYYTPRFPGRKRGRLDFDTPIPTSVRVEAMPTTGRRTRRGRRGRRRRMNNDVGGCYTKQTWSIGTKLPRPVYRKKLLDTGRISNIFRVSGQTQNFQTDGALKIRNAIAQPYGFYPLTCGQTGTGAPLIAPIYAIDLTSVPNGGSTGTASVAYPNSLWRMNYATEIKGSNITWTTFNSPPASSASFYPENVQTNFQPGPRDILDWVQAKFLFYPATLVPTRINVDIVTFNDDVVVPGGINATSGTTVTDSYAKAFWESMMKKYMFSPLENGNSNLEKKFVTYLDRKEIILDCKTNIENEKNHIRQLNIFKRMDRVCVYNWGDTGVMNARPLDSATPQVDQPGTAGEDWITNNAVTNQNTVRPGVRVFMLIRAFAGQVQGSADFNAKYHPSFDMVCRVKHSQLKG